MTPALCALPNLLSARAPEGVPLQRARFNRLARVAAPLQPRKSRAWLRTALLGGALWLSFAPGARADANVVVELKRADGSPAEGTVLLSKGELKLRCTTSQGRCEIKNVPGGSYTVEVETGAQPAGKPKLVMIPPSGEVKLNVAAK